MTENSNSNSSGENTSTPAPGICPVCHQPVLPQYYFCPNCGTKLTSAPLSTTVMTQLWIYLHSIILPMIVFITISKWRGLKYSRSKDPKTRQIGQIAWILLIISIITTIWLVWQSTVWLEQAVQSYVDNMTTDLNNINLQ